MRINPLLLPPDDNDADRVFLKWNMLFASAHCIRSKDRPHISWAEGRSEPATFPRVTHLRIVSKTFPWMINIIGRNRAVGVTCGEVIDGIDEYLHKLLRGDEYKACSRNQQRLITEAYNHNRAPAHGVPGGVLGSGLRRLDWLCQDTMFGGIIRNDRFVKEVAGDVLPCTFELKCVLRYPLTAREIREQEEREREAARERDRSAERNRSRDRRRATVESDESEDY